MKLKDLRTQKGQQKLLNSLILWLVAQNKFDCALDLLESSAAKSFIVEYIEDKIHQIKKIYIAEKLQLGLINNYKRLLSNEVDMRFNKAIYDKDTNTIKFVKDLPELNTTDKNQPDSINKLMCEQFTNINKTDVFLFACAGRGSDALYMCKTYGIAKSNCYFIEKNSRLCKRLKSLGFKNVICGDVLSENTWKLLYNILEKNNMEINKVLMNPPYDGNLHLDILEKVLKELYKDGCEIVSIQPARWLEDPLAEYKQSSDAKKYKKSITDKICSLQLIDATTACTAFKIMNATDLAIYTFNNNKSDIIITKQLNLINNLYNKIKTMISLQDKVEANAIDGFRCEVKKLTSGTGGHNLGNYDSSKLADVNIVWGPYTDGYTKEGIFFNAARQKNQFTKDCFAHSIKFNTLDEANKFYLSCNTKFYRRLIHLFKWDVNVPLRFLPYMEDYSKVWTDEDYCKFFDLTEEESEFMCRKVDDYRVKDFINYINLDEE